MKRALLGAALGFGVGLVAAVNLVIFSGIGDGYETRIDAVFRESTVIGLLIVLLWIVTPVAGAYFAWRTSENRSSGQS